MLILIKKKIIKKNPGTCLFIYVGTWCHQKSLMQSLKTTSNIHFFLFICNNIHTIPIFLHLKMQSYSSSDFFWTLLGIHSTWELSITLLLTWCEGLKSSKLNLPLIKIFFWCPNLCSFGKFLPKVWRDCRLFSSRYPGYDPYDPGAGIGSSRIC